MRHGLPILILALSSNMSLAGIELPSHKPGLWEQKSTTSYGTDVTQFCTDGDTANQMLLQQSAAAENCDIGFEEIDSSTYVSDGTCNTAEGITIKSHTEFKGDFESAYTATSTITTSGMPTIADMLPDNLPEETRAKIMQSNPSAGNGEMVSEVTMEAKWLGPCADDQKPGDVIMPDGRKVNVFDIPKGMDALEPPALPN